MDEFKRDDPNVIIPLTSTLPRVEETIVIQRESSAGWWAVGILCSLVLVVAVWLLTRPDGADDLTDLRLAQAEAAAAEAQATAANAVNATSATVSDRVAIAQAEAMEARADAVRATQEARAAEAQAAAPIVVERGAVVRPAASNGTAVVTSTSPQP